MRAALPEEREQALLLLFQHCSESEQRRRTECALELIEAHQLNPEGLCMIEENSALHGVILYQVLPGGTGLIWPPQVRERSNTATEDKLLQGVVDRLQRQQIKVAQALLEIEEKALEAPLLRNGFQHITGLWYLRHFLQTSIHDFTSSDWLTFQSYREGDPDQFAMTLERTYESTLDCPEMTGRRSIEEILRGHRAEERHDPDLWWLAREHEQPVGVILLTPDSLSLSWELEYMGVVASARGQGIGREMLSQVRLEAKLAEVQEVTLTVDQRNHPARALYRSLGFEPYDYREVYLRFL